MSASPKKLRPVGIREFTVLDVDENYEPPEKPHLRAAKFDGGDGLMQARSLWTTFHDVPGKAYKACHRTIGLLIPPSPQIGCFPAPGEVMREPEKSCKSRGLAGFPSVGQMARSCAVMRTRRESWLLNGYVAGPHNKEEPMTVEQLNASRPLSLRARDVVDLLHEITEVETQKRPRLDDGRYAADLIVAGSHGRRIAVKVEPDGSVTWGCVSP